MYCLDSMDSHPRFISSAANVNFIHSRVLNVYGIRYVNE